MSILATSPCKYALNLEFRENRHLLEDLNFNLCISPSMPFETYFSAGTATDLKDGLALRIEPGLHA